jgi:hypothetical protein
MRRRPVASGEGGYPPLQTVWRVQTLSKPPIASDFDGIALPPDPFEGFVGPFPSSWAPIQPLGAVPGGAESGAAALSQPAGSCRRRFCHAF